LCFCAHSQANSHFLFKPLFFPFQNDKSGIGSAINNAGGGGAEGEKKEDYLDKGIDMFQERVLNQGAQDNETATEQAKDNLIADQIRSQWKERTGSDFPIQDKQ
jgi:hypothetical protein